MKMFLLGLFGLTAMAFAEDIVVTVTNDKGQPVESADVVAILKSGAYQNAKLDKADGKYKCSPTEECIKIFAGAAGHEAAVKRYSGSQGAATVALKASETKGSAVIRRSGSLPGINGGLNPVMDAKGQTYLYSTKIGLTKNGKAAPQPVQFSLDRSIDATTDTGLKFKITVLEITPQVSLLEFTNPK
jgi:hypothetical protein